MKIGSIRREISLTIIVLFLYLYRLRHPGASITTHERRLVCGGMCGARSRVCCHGLLQQGQSTWRPTQSSRDPRQNFYHGIHQWHRTGMITWLASVLLLAGSSNACLWHDAIFSQGMVYLHATPIQYHGNLKSSNVLIDSRWTCKLADFGQAELRAGEDSWTSDELADQYGTIVIS